jgi:hypothetical protein
MQLIFPVIFFLISLKWGKWHNWRQYYPTMLLMVVGNLLYSSMFKEYPMWSFEHTFEEKILPTTMSIDLLKTFTTFPILTLVFLSNYPEDKSVIKKVLHILTWTLIFGAIEYIAKLLGMISYHNGWSMWWSLLFDFTMFSLLIVHYKRPIIAWLLSILFTLFLWSTFDLSFKLLE